MELFLDRINRRIVDADLNILCIVAEGLSVQCQTADVCRVFLDCETEADAAGVVQMQHIDRDVRDFQTVDVGALFVDHEQLQQTVLVAVDRPPFRCEDAAHVTEVCR